MSDYTKVSLLTYTQICDHFKADELHHAMMLGNVTLGYMEEVDRDEDRMYFDYYVSEYYYNRYQLACI
jgi:hypothetical protein